MDDGHKGQYLNAFPLLSSRGIPASVYVIRDRILNPYYVTVTELQEMVVAGWEVGGHGEFPLTTMSDEQLEAEVKASKEVLQSHGFSPRTFAYPHGKYDTRVVSVVKKYYEAALHTSSTGLPYTASELGSDGDKPWTQFGRYHIYTEDSTSKAMQYIDQAIAERGWMIFFFHDCFADGTVDEGANLLQIANYIKSKVDLGVLKAVTFSEGLDIWKGDEPPPPSPDEGTLLCDATHNGIPVTAGAKVYYNEILVASETTPFSVELIPGTYKVKGTYLGLETEETAIVESQESSSVTLTFTGEPVAGLLLNPNFEMWTDGKPDFWKIDWNRPTIKVTQSTDVYEGDYAAAVYSELLYNGINQQRFLSDMNLQDGDKLTVSGWLKNVQGVQKARIAIRFYSATGQQIGYGAYQTVTLLDTAWVQSKSTVTIPTNTYSIQVQINPTAWISGFVKGTFEADALSLTETP